LSPPFTSSKHLHNYHYNNHRTICKFHIQISLMAINYYLFILVTIKNGLIIFFHVPYTLNLCTNSFKCIAICACSVAAFATCSIDKELASISAFIVSLFIEACCTSEAED